jgi:hypothetical protein
VEEPGGGKIYIHANHVKAFEGQKENAKAIENLTKGVVKGVTGQ